MIGDDQLQAPSRRSTMIGWRSSPRLVLVALGVAYGVTGWLSPRALRKHPSIDVYLVRPVVWVGLAVLAFLAWRVSDARRPIDRSVILASALAGGAHVGVLGLAGLVWGFGHSPGAVGPGNLPLHTWYLLSGLAGVEVARPVLLRSWARWDEDRAFVLVTVLLFFIGVPPAQYALLANIDSAVRLVGGVWVPAFAVSAVATWLCVRGGLGPSFVYRGILATYAAFLPVLPRLGWAVQMASGLVAAVVACVLVRALSDPEAGDIGRVRGSTVRPGEAIGVVVIAAVLAGGLSGLRTMTVTGISMEPTYHRGDVVVVLERFDPGALVTGDIVIYDNGSLTVAHRIVSLEGDTIVTQGDNVDRPDRPIDVEDVTGKVVGRLPLFGYPYLWASGR